MPDGDQVIQITVVLPRRRLSDLTSPHPWSESVGRHEWWENLPDDSMRTATVEVVWKLAVQWESDRRSLADDPWLDDKLAERFTERVRWVIETVLKRDDLALSAAELALLITFPYLYQAFWARQAVETLQGTDPAAEAFSTDREEQDFRAFVAEHGTLHRRGIRAFEVEDRAATSIGWWLFHRWLAQQPGCYRLGNVAAMLPKQIQAPLDAVLRPARLMELMRVVRIDPAFLRDTEREQALRPVVVIAGGSVQEQEVREQLIGYLLVFAHRTTIDPAVLPRVIADHIGIDDGVTPEEVLHSIRKAAWDGHRTRVLTTEWTHPATALMLRKHAAMVDAVLTEIARIPEGTPRLEPLKNLPVHASAEGITSEGHRFRLADDRIQELLMGEQLYGTAELAIRELYQNALDACRYREARTTYLAKTGWTGRIEFRQDVDERGRPYLECADNGIGMGDRELVEVFSRAGIRFTDLPEYVEERADWAAKGIESYPNSRFGIGVLSYFMLADEITVTTCRFSRKGRPDQRLEVHIAGPGALFRVRDLGQGDDAGTVVRLWLRPTGKPVHCTDLLRRILWVSDYRVSSDDLSGRQTWEPGVLSAMAPIGTDALADDARKVAGQVIPAEGGRIWWCDTEGAVLADGIWAGTSLFGAVVNLTGRDMPRLTIDRRTIISLDRLLVEDLMRTAIPALLGKHSPLSHRWLSTLVSDMPRLADDICERAIEVSYKPWRIAETEVPIEVVGCFPLDEKILSDYGHPPYKISDGVGNWRLAAWLQAHPHPDTREIPDAVVPALPADEILLTLESPTTSTTEVQPSDRALELGHVLAAALRAQRSPGEVTARLAMLGYPVTEHLPAEAKATDPVLLGRFRPGRPPWLDRRRPVSHRHVIAAAVESGLPPRAVADRLIELGFEVSTSSRLPAVVHPVDKTLLPQVVSASLDELDVPVPAAHVMIAAAKTGRTPAEVGRRLAELGYTVPEGLPRDPDSHDEITFANHTNLFETYLRNPVPVLHITIASIKSGRPPAAIRERLAAAGLEVPPEGDVPEAISPADAVLTRTHHPDGVRSELTHKEAEIALGHVLCAAAKTNQTPVQVARRLVELGYITPPFDQLPDVVDEHDPVLVSSGIGADRDSYQFNRQLTWLPFGTQVSPQHIAIAAAKTGRSPRVVADRLGQLGFGTPREELLEFDAHDDDITLLSASLNGKPPWLIPSHPALVATDLTLPIGHAIAAAHRLGKSPAKVVARLTSLGLRTETADLPAESDPMDVDILSRALDISRWWIYHPAEFLWLGVTTPVDALHLVLAAARTRRSPAAVARRLSDLGIPVISTHELPQSVDQDDLFLLSTSPTKQEPFRSLETPFPRGQVMLAAHRLRTSPGNVLDRLRRLGLTLGP